MISGKISKITCISYINGDIDLVSLHCRELNKEELEGPRVEGRHPMSNYSWKKPILCTLKVPL
jgi:hypothetical protein